MPICGGCGGVVDWDLREVALTDTVLHLCVRCDMAARRSRTRRGAA